MTLETLRRLPIRYGRRADIHQAFTLLGCCLSRASIFSAATGFERHS